MAEVGNVSGPTRVLFLYWGRRGLSRFALELARAALADERLDATISVSRQNESFPAFAEFRHRLLPVDTFQSNVGALTQAWRVPLLQRSLADYCLGHRIQAVIELMPHVWSSLVLPSIKRGGARYATIVHDAETHPGDYRSYSIQGLIDRSIAQADVVLTLSKAVAGRLIVIGRAPRSKVFTLFHPDLDFGGSVRNELPRPGEPLRLAFLGRIMPYKGLPLFVDTIELLRRDGMEVEAGVFGEGALGHNADRLKALGAEVVNRWLTETEISDALSRYHALVLSHIEASQSGVAAAAFGAGLPVVATPVGGLIEQVFDGINGVMATSADSYSLADAVKRLAADPQLYGAMSRYLRETKAERSMTRFIEDCVSHALYARLPEEGA
jgi:glycosyltransferase involved in cell wall biosynthesis